MEQWVNKVAIVTGVTSGIGQEIAVQLVKNGVKVVGLGRRNERLDELKENLTNQRGEYFPICCDITKESDVLNAFSWTKQNLGGVDILINNAGVWLDFNGLCKGSSENWKKIFDTNILGLALACQEAVKSMNERNVAGHIININSILGHKIPSQLVSSINVYPASKYAVTGLTETLRLELAQNKSNIKVTSISPGLVATELFGSSTIFDMVSEVVGVTPLNVSDIAEAVLYVLSTPSRVNVTELIIQPVGDPL